MCVFRIFHGVHQADVWNYVINHVRSLQWVQCFIHIQGPIPVMSYGFLYCSIELCKCLVLAIFFKSPRHIATVGNSGWLLSSTIYWLANTTDILRLRPLFVKHPTDLLVRCMVCEVEVFTSGLRPSLESIMMRPFTLQPMPGSRSALLRLGAGWCMHIWDVDQTWIRSLTSRLFQMHQLSAICPDQISVSLTADDMQWNASHTQPCCKAKPSMPRFHLGGVGGI